MSATTTPSPIKATKLSAGVSDFSTGTLYVVCFAKMVDDKQDGIYLAGVYFGGAAADRNGAEQIARDCVNTVRGGTIIPRIFPVNGRHQLLATMREATQRFQRLEAEMISAEEIITRSNKRK